MKSALFIALALWCIAPGCRPTDVEPPEAASFYYRSDGTRRIPPTAVPKVTSTITDNTILADNVRFTTTPLPLPDGNGFLIGTAQGEVLIFGPGDSLSSRARLPVQDPVFRLAANGNSFVALQNNGAITVCANDGKVQHRLNTDSLSRADINLIENNLLVIADQGISCYDVVSGKKQFHLSTSLTPVSAASVGDKFFVALSRNAATGSDSAYIISRAGVVERRIGFAGLRVTSNIAVTGEGHYYMTFGAQGELDASGVRRRTFIVSYKISGDGEVKETLRQELEYIPTNISVSNDIALASGFQMSGEEYSGAIDAFVISTNEKLWQRRFTEPLGSPVAVTTQNVFFPLSFDSKADIPSSSVLIALELSSGATAREFAIQGARNGFVPGLPIPYKGSLLLADALTATIYKLTAE